MSIFDFFKDKRTTSNSQEMKFEDIELKGSQCLQKDDLQISIDSDVITKLSNVENLEEVIRILSSTIGEEVFNSKQFYNIINDLSKVFRIYPQYKYIVRGLIEWRIININKLKSLTENQLLNEVDRFSQKTGFNKDIVLDIFIALANGLGNEYKLKNNKYSQKERITKVQNETTVVDTISSTGKCTYDHSNTINWTFLHESISKGLDLGNVKIKTSDSIIIQNLKDKIYFIPTWHNYASLKIENIDLDVEEAANESYYSPKLYSTVVLSRGKDHDISCLKISYKVLGSDNTGSHILACTKYDIETIIFNTDGQPILKAPLTRIDTSKKYAIEQGEIKINTIINNIGAILIVPMFGDIDNYSRSVCSKNFEKYNGEITIEIPKSSDLILNKPLIYGHKFTCSILMSIDGKVDFNKGFKIGNSYIIAFFNANNSLIESKNIFIGKSGYVGPRGGLYDTTRGSGKVKYIYFDIIDQLSCEFSNVAKIIITEE